MTLRELLDSVDDERLVVLDVETECELDELLLDTLLIDDVLDELPLLDEDLVLWLEELDSFVS